MSPPGAGHLPSTRTHPPARGHSPSARTDPRPQAGDAGVATVTGSLPPRPRPGARPSRALAGSRAARPRAIRITVDVHELRSGIPEGLASLGAVVRTAPLAAGDYALGGGTLVERKRVLDLHTAVGKGRFWPQLMKLRDSCPHPYLLIEGTDIDRGPLHPASVRSICLAVIGQGVPVLRSYQQKDSAIWLYRLALRANRALARRDRPPYAQRPAARGSEETAEAVVAAVPGISTALARALLARFGTVGGVIGAGPQAWLEVPGIGPTRVRALERTFASDAGGGSR